MADYRLHAPRCALPDCNNLVNYHKRYTKEDQTVGWKWKTFCEKHRTTPVGKEQVQEFFKRRGGCENRDGRLGRICQDPDTPSLTFDHIDGNKHNNQEDNGQALCANCHNIKTKKFRDYEKRYSYVPKAFTELFTEVYDEPQEAEKI